MTACPDCGFENRVGIMICENCGADLYDSLLEQVATKRLGRQDSDNGQIGDTGAIATLKPLVFYITKNETPLAVERTGDLIFGRYDVERSDIQVDVDLAHYHALDLGVSRQHIRLNTKSEPPMATDLGSYNGTYVNGQKLIPDRPYPLNSGDELRLGRLVMRLYYK